jgi:hypothetical protein
MKPAAEVLEIARDDLESLLERVRPSLSEEDYRKLKAVVEGLSYLTELIRRQGHDDPRPAPAAVPAGDGEDAGGAGAGWHRRGTEAGGSGGDRQ